MSAFDDYLNAPTQQAAPSFDAYLGAPVPASVAGGTGAAPVQAAAGQPNLSPPPLGGFLTGVGDAAKGTAQALVHGIAWGANKIAPDSQFAKDANASLPQMQAAIDQQNQAYAAQRAANGSSGFDPMRTLGNIAGTAPSMALGPEFAGLSLPAKIGVGAMQGAAGAGMMPASAPTDDNSYAQQKLTQMGVGGALGAAAPLAFAGASAAGKGLWNVAQPIVQPGKFVGQGLSGAMDAGAAAQAASNIRGAQQFVPGSVPTTAQAGANPMLVQTEKALANSNPDFKTALMQQQIGNNQARWNTLMGVAQTPEALQAAQTARSDAVAPLYDAANSQTTNVGKAFINFARRPAVTQAMQQADQLAQNEGIKLKWPTPDDRSINGQALDYTSRALGDMIDTAKRSGADQQARALTDAQNYLKGWTSSYIPAVKQASQTYAQMSVPVNTMEAGQQIANSIGTRAMDASGVPNIQLPAFRTALTQAMKGQQFGIDANAHQALQGIGQDLQRATVSNSVPAGGSDTAYNIAANGWLAKNLYGPSFNGATGIGKGVAAAATAFAGHPMAGLGILGAGNKLGQAVGSKLQGKLSNYMLNPQSLLPYLDARAASAAGQTGPGAAMQGLLNYGRPAAVNGLLGNFLNPSQ